LPNVFSPCYSCWKIAKTFWEILQNFAINKTARDKQKTGTGKRPSVLEILCSPVILLGGLRLAFILNLFPVLTLRFEQGSAGLTGVITFKPVLIHWTFVGMSLLMVWIILIYAPFGNFGPF
jgi:L-cystine uptake protein TcyP (sodium:dicarboxylate symporter family)